jgi:acyl carrier protein
MENKSTRRNLYRVLRKTGVKRENIQLNASYNDDLKFDQVDWTLFIYYLESLFQIRLTDRDIEKMRSVSDTLTLLKGKKYIEY